MITVACVRAGQRYGVGYVERLRNMVARHLAVPYRFICLTDDLTPIDDVELIDIRGLGLRGWWAKMGLFNPQLRGPGRCLYFDLDTVIVDDLAPLAEWAGTFGICQNFTKLAGNKRWPCNYGSCVMSLADGFGESIFDRFMAQRARWIARCPRGDQQAIELLYPGAAYLQDVSPPGYFVGRREFTDERPDGAAVMVFAGNHKPHNTPHQWLRDEWR